MRFVCRGRQCGVAGAGEEQSDPLGVRVPLRRPVGVKMNSQTKADTPVSSAGAVYFVGPGADFTKVALRTVETELDAPAHRVPNLEALGFAQMAPNGRVRPAHMVVVHEDQAQALLDALRAGGGAGAGAGAGALSDTRIAIAFHCESFASALFSEICDELLQWQVSLLPMNTNVTNWVRLLQVIQSGGHYVPPQVLRIRQGAGPGAGGHIGGSVALRAVPDADPAPAEASAAPAERATPECAAPGHAAPKRAAVPAAEPGQPDGLTPREAEVLAMAAAGSPNKIIAGELDLSEHTVKLYMHRVISKLGVKNRTEAAVWFHRNGLRAEA